MPDIHVPYEDRVAMRAAAAVIKDWKPHKVLYLGDVVDVEQLARFSRTKQHRQDSLQEELDQWRELAPWFQHLCGGSPEWHLVPGNHEHRILKWSFGQANVSLRCLTIPNLLSLPELGIKYIASEQLELARGKFCASHGTNVRKWAGATARAEMESSGRCGVTGHTHRESVYHETRGKTILTHIESGCLCENPPPYRTRPLNWQQAITLGEFHRTNGTFWADTVSIRQGVARFGKKTWLARGR